MAASESLRLVEYWRRYSNPYVICGVVSLFVLGQCDAPYGTPRRSVP